MRDSRSLVGLTSLPSNTEIISRPPSFRGPQNFIKREKTALGVTRVKALHSNSQQLPGPPPVHKNPVSAPDKISVLTCGPRDVESPQLVGVVGDEGDQEAVSHRGEGESCRAEVPRPLQETSRRVHISTLIDRDNVKVILCQKILKLRSGNENIIFITDINFAFQMLFIIIL